MARYFLRFRHSDTGLAPTFTFFKKASDLSTQVAPPIAEVGFGTYYFEYSPSFDIVFEVDGGSSIPTEEIRYIADTISPKDFYIDKPISAVRTDVWTDEDLYGPNQKGTRVNQLGDPTDASSAPTMFGKNLLHKESIRGDSAGTSDGDSVKVARDRIMGGTGFGGTGIDNKTIKDTVGTPSDTSASSTVFGKSLLYKESIRGDSAGTSDGENVKLARDRILGGTGYGGTGVDVKNVSDRVGDSGDTSSQSTLFGKSLLYKESVRGDSAGTNDGDNIKSSRDRVMGGTGFGGTGVDVKTVKDSVGSSSDTSSSATLFGKTLLYKENVRGDSAGLTDGNSIKQAYDRVGAPSSTTISADIAAVKSDVSGVQTTSNNINTKLGTPAGASVSADVAAVKSDTAAIKGRTDNLPIDPASQSTTNTSITNAVSSIKGADARDLTQLAGSGVFVPGSDSLHQLKSSISALPSSSTIAGDVWDVTLSSHTASGSTGAKLNSGSTSTEVGNVTTAVKGGGNIDNTQVYNRLGAPVTSVSADIAAVKSDTGTINTNTASLSNKLTRALGLMHENSVLDQTTYDGSNNLTAGRLRIYDSKANALAAGATGLLNTYSIAATYSGQNVQTYTVVLE